MPGSSRLAWRYSPRRVSRNGRVGRVDLVADDVADPLAVGVRRALDAARDDRLVDRDGEHPLELGDGPLGHDRRRGQPGAEALAQDVGVGGHERRVGVQARDERLEALGRVDRLELGQLRAGAAAARPSGRRRAAGGGPGRPPRSASSPMTWSMSRVMRSSVESPSTGIAAASAAVRSMSARALARPAGDGILEPVGVALVAVERGGRRVELEDRPPRSGRRASSTGEVGSVIVGGRLRSCAGEGRHAGGRPRSVAVRVPRRRGADASRSTPATGRSAAEQRHLLAAALDHRIQAEERLEVGEVGRSRGEERSAGGPT